MRACLMGLSSFLVPILKFRSFGSMLGTANPAGTHADTSEYWRNTCTVPHRQDRPPSTAEALAPRSDPIIGVLALGPRCAVHADITQ